MLSSFFRKLKIQAYMKLYADTYVLYRSRGYSRSKSRKEAKEMVSVTWNMNRVLKKFLRKTKRRRK